MKIALDHTIFLMQPYGGISRYFYCLLKELIENKIDIKVISALHKNKFLKSLSGKYTSGIYLPNYPLLDVLERYNNFNFNRYIRDNSTNIIHDTYYTSNIKKPLKTKKVITVHDLIHEKFQNFYRNAENEIDKKKKSFVDCDHFICVSNNTKKDLLQYYDIEKSKISVIYHGANHLSKKLDKIYLKTNDPYILFVGKRAKYKNFIFLLKTYAKSMKLMKNFKIVCFGGDSFNKNEIKLIDKLKIGKNIIHVKGNDELLGTYYFYARALISPSLYEGFGLNIIEAMSFNCPVICSNIDVFREICKENAIYFDPYNEDELLNNLENYLFKDNFLKNLSLNANDNAKKFTWKKNSTDTINVYKELI